MAGVAYVGLVLERQLLEVVHGEQMVVGAREVRRRDEREAAGDALDGQLAVFAGALRTMVAGGGQFAGLVDAVDVTVCVGAK